MYSIVNNFFLNGSKPLWRQIAGNQYTDKRSIFTLHSSRKVLWPIIYLYEVLLWYQEPISIWRTRSGYSTYLNSCKYIPLYDFYIFMSYRLLSRLRMWINIYFHMILSRVMFYPHGVEFRKVVNPSQPNKLECWSYLSS